jgi:hypothetical protein
LSYAEIENGKRIYLYHSVKGVDVKNVNNELILGELAPPIGLEPMTDWLTASRST